MDAVTVPVFANLALSLVGLSRGFSGWAGFFLPKRGKWTSSLTSRSSFSRSFSMLREE